MEIKTVVATVEQATLQGLNPISLPRRQRPPLDRRTRDKGAEAEWGRRLTDSEKGPGQIPHSVLIGQIWVTLPVWNAIENSCFGPPLLCYFAVAGLLLWAQRSTLQEWCRISRKTAKESSQKEERGSKAYDHGKATSGLLFGTRCHGCQSPCVCLCVSELVRFVGRTS